MAKKINEYEIPSVFSLRRSVETTDGIIDNVLIEERTFRTVKNFAGSKKENENKESSNIAKGEVAIATENIVNVNFDLKFLKLELKVENCNDVEFYKKFNEKLKEENQQLLQKIAGYYAFNLINGRWLWRNRVIADGVDIEIKKYRYGEEKPAETVVVKDADMLDLDIKLNENNKIVAKTDKEALEKVSGWIYEEIYWGKPYYLEINAKLYTEKGMQLYPSQLFVNGKEGRKFARVGDKGAITYQKIGDALRTFDVWYKDYKELQEPIVVEFFGGSLKFQKNFRDKKDSAFTVMSKYINDEELSETERLYLMAV